MHWLASAPGKVVLLGEYAVLDGTEALVMACPQRCTVAFGLSPETRCQLTMVMPEISEQRFDPGTASGSTLVDTVLAGLDPVLPGPAWAARIDSSAFFHAGSKLGLGSSAAALVAFAGACQRAAGRPEPPPLATLIACHRAFQGGAGSGIDVAAAYAGGVIGFALDPDRNPRIGSVRLPEGVAFAGVFAGTSASTPDLVGKYRQWLGTGSVRTAALRQRMTAVAQGGLAAAREQDGAAFVAAIDAYGDCLGELGREIGADLVTRAHARIGALAGKYGLAYKVSGAGGGDVGIACGLDAAALREFAVQAGKEGFHVVGLSADEHGLQVEERTG